MFIFSHARYFIPLALNFSYIGFKRPIAQLRVGRVTLNNSYHSRVVGMKNFQRAYEFIGLIMHNSSLSYHK
jgi:hypothetical protein